LRKQKLERVDIAAALLQTAAEKVLCMLFGAYRKQSKRSWKWKWGSCSNRQFAQNIELAYKTNSGHP